MKLTMKKMSASKAAKEVAAVNANAEPAAKSEDTPDQAAAKTEKGGNE